MLDPLNRRRFLGVTGAAFAGAIVLDGATLPALAERDTAQGATVKRSGDTWRLENDVLRVKLKQSRSGIAISSVHNRQAAQEYQVAPGGRQLFTYEFDGKDTVGADSGWTVLQPIRGDLRMHTPRGRVRVGRELRIPLRRTDPCRAPGTPGFRDLRR